MPRAKDQVSVTITLPISQYETIAQGARLSQADWSGFIRIAALDAAREILAGGAFVPNVRVETSPRRGRPARGTLIERSTSGSLNVANEYYEVIAEAAHKVELPVATFMKSIAMDKAEAVIRSTARAQRAAPAKMKKAANH